MNGDQKTHGGHRRDNVPEGHEILMTGISAMPVRFIPGPHRFRPSMDMGFSFSELERTVYNAQMESRRNEQQKQHARAASVTSGVTNSHQNRNSTENGIDQRGSLSRRGLGTDSGAAVSRGSEVDRERERGQGMQSSNKSSASNKSAMEPSVTGGSHPTVGKLDAVSVQLQSSRVGAQPLTQPGGHKVMFSVPNPSAGSARAAGQRAENEEARRAVAAKDVVTYTPPQPPVAFKPMHDAPPDASGFPHEQEYRRLQALSYAQQQSQHHSQDEVNTEADAGDQNMPNFALATVMSEYIPSGQRRIRGAGETNAARDPLSPFFITRAQRDEEGGGGGEQEEQKGATGYVGSLGGAVPHRLSGSQAVERMAVGSNSNLSGSFTSGSLTRSALLSTRAPGSGLESTRSRSGSISRAAPLTVRFEDDGEERPGAKGP